MLIADVNVFITSHRPSDPDHAAMLSWLEAQLSAHQAFGVSELVLSAFVRIVTNHRAFADSTPPDIALDFCAVVRAAPATTIVAPGKRHWTIFAELVRTGQARSNTVPDAYLAALAIENGATFVTRDRGFARFPGLRLLDPLAA
jgi:toxin-antitoxin system PIN domain toxin